MELEQQIAENLLFPIWRCINSDFKEKYKADAWGIYENFLRASSYSASLPQFFEQLKRLIRIDFQLQFDKQIMEVLRGGNDHEVLQTIRMECSYLVLLTRDLNNQRKELFKKTDE